MDEARFGVPRYTVCPRPRGDVLRPDHVDVEQGHHPVHVEPNVWVVHDL